MRLRGGDLTSGRVRLSSLRTSLRASLPGLLMLLLGVGCGDPRPTLGTRSQCISWKQEIAPLLSDNCGSCHSGGSPAGGLDTSSYLAVLGGGEVRVRAVAGDPDSVLLQVLKKESATSAHQGIADSVREQIQHWVVDCKVSYLRSVQHQGGILNPDDPQGQFHGALLRATGYQLSACTGCHGEDLSGGKAKSSCLTCHSQGVTTCATCHARLPAVHRAHTQGTTQGKSFACAACHPQPRFWNDPGHVSEADGSARTTKVRVALGSLANLTPASYMRSSAATFDSETKQCTSVYCHGGVFPDRAATNTAPLWTGTAKEAACGTCHGLPPSTHDASQTRCSLCHNRTATADQKLLSGGRHLSGISEIGDGSGTCAACHGYTGSTPFQDLAAQTDQSLLGVGAHAAHVNASHRLSAPLPCSECHGSVTPIPNTSRHTVNGQGVRLFPAGSGAKLSELEGAKPTWDRISARCSTNYCHGGGSKLLTDLSPGVNRTPVWTASSQASCGSCHGIPPKDGNHTATMRLADCATCHAKTIDASGTILFVGPVGAQKTSHLNGVADGN
jgi:predicted CxxxxCH...CXXCH cytochrome family protein